MPALSIILSITRLPKSELHSSTGITERGIGCTTDTHFYEKHLSIGIINELNKRFKSEFLFISVFIIVFISFIFYQ